MESTAVRTEKVETSNVPSRSSYRLTFWLRASARPLMLAGGDFVAAILAAVLAMSAVSVPPNPYFQAIDLVYIPLVLGCCLVVGLYDRHETDPVGRLRMRANATLGSSLVELLAIALQTPIGGVVFYMGVRAVLFFVLSFYIEYAAEGRFERSSFGPGLIQPLHMGRRAPDWFKRAADAGVALVAGILALPFLAVSVAAIWLVDRGPAFYSQKRIGLAPFSWIEPGMHTAPIKSIGVDAACTMMVTGSDDKTARLWALPPPDSPLKEFLRTLHGSDSPQLLRTLRVPIGEGVDGKVYAVALSPDGKLVAAGGWNRTGDHWVYIFEAATGRLVTRLGRLGNVIGHLAFSPDGSRLAATLAGGGGMRLWELAGWQLLAEHRDYGGKSSYGAAFDGANRLFTVAFDGQIRRYDADGHLEAKGATQGGKEPFSIAVHLRDSKLVIGFDDTAAVEVYDAGTLNRLYAADKGGISGGGDLSSVAWSLDGARLYAGGRYGSPTAVVTWQDEGRGKRSEAPLSQNTIMQLLPRSGGIAAGTADPAFGLIAEDGTKRVWHKRFWQEGVTFDQGFKLRDAFTLAADGVRVRFGLGVGGGKPVLFDLAAFRLADAAESPARLAASRTFGLAVSDWENGLAPKLNSKPIALKDYETSRALAIAPDDSRFVLGTEWFLRTYRADGGKLWQKPVPGSAWGVNISHDGRLVVAACGDGTIRWYRLSDGQELLALFVHAKDRRFVAWTPKGFYAASPGAEDLIGWHVNRDWDHAPDFYPASRFREQFNRPDVVKRVLDDLNEDKAIAEANRLADAKPAEEIAKKLPPVITILFPGEGSAFAGGSLSLRYSVRSPSGLAVTEVSSPAACSIPWI